MTARRRLSAVKLLVLLSILTLPGELVPGRFVRDTAATVIESPVMMRAPASSVAGDLTSVPMPPAGGAHQGDPADSRDLTCADFSSQADAQVTLDADTSDPFGLDIDLDGIACETPPITPTERDAARARQAQREGQRRPVPAATPEPVVMPEEPRDVDCVEFTYQEDAQRVYDGAPGDPYNLDPSGDGFACSSLPSRNEPVR